MMNSADEKLEKYESKYDASPLHRAIYDRDLKKLSKLLQVAGCDVNIWTDQTPVHLAIRYGLVECLEMIMHHHTFDVNHRYKNGYTPLHLAAQASHSPMLEATHEAASECLNKLIGHPNLRDVNARDVHGNTAIHLAALAGNVAGVQMLLRHPSFTDVNLQNRYRCTCVHLAVQTDAKDCLMGLIRHPSFDYTIKNCLEKTALHNPEIKKECNWQAMKGLCLLAEALKQYWDRRIDNDTIRSEEAHVRIKSLSTRTFFYGKRFSKHVISFLGFE